MTALTKSLLLPLAAALLPVLPSPAEPDRSYEIWPTGAEAAEVDEHSLIYSYTEQDDLITAITETYAPGLRRWELHYRYDKHGSCLGAQLRHAHRSEEDAPWQYEEKELEPGDSLDLPCAARSACVYERAEEARLRVACYLHGQRSLNWANAPEHVHAAWTAVILRAPGELDELLTAHPELLQWRFFEGLTRSGAPFSQDILSLAIEEGAPRLVEVVLRHGVSPNRLQRRLGGGELATTLDLTPLAEVLRASGGHPDAEAQTCELLALLVKHGADVNLTLADGSTPLHLAAGRHREGIILPRAFLLLRALGAKDDVPNKSGETPLDLLRGVLHDEGLLPNDEP